MSQNSKNKKFGESVICLQHHSLGLPFGGQLLVLLRCTKVGLSGRPYENRSAFLSLMLGGKEKKLFSKRSFLKIRLVKAALYQGAASRET